MEKTAPRFETRPMDEVRKELLGRAKAKRNPFIYTIYEEVEPVVTRLRSVDREEWAQAFSALSEPYEEKAARAEAAGDQGSAMKNYLIAYDYYHVARYPAPNSPGKIKAYRKSRRISSRPHAMSIRRSSASRCLFTAAQEKELSPWDISAGPKVTRLLPW